MIIFLKIIMYFNEQEVNEQVLTFLCSICAFSSIFRYNFEEL